MNLLPEAELYFIEQLKSIVYLWTKFQVHFNARTIPNHQELFIGHLSLLSCKIVQPKTQISIKSDDLKVLHIIQYIERTANNLFVDLKVSADMGYTKKTMGFSHNPETNHDTNM